jgi:hypothetical protein
MPNPILKPKLADLKNGRRIFNNKTDFTGYDFFDERFIELTDIEFDCFPLLILFSVPKEMLFQVVKTGEILNC